MCHLLYIRGGVCFANTLPLKEGVPEGGGSSLKLLRKRVYKNSSGTVCPLLYLEEELVANTLPLHKRRSAVTPLPCCVLNPRRRGSR